MQLCKVQPGRCKRACALGKTQGLGFRGYDIGLRVLERCSGEGIMGRIQWGSAVGEVGLGGCGVGAWNQGTELTGTARPMGRTG